MPRSRVWPRTVHAPRLPCFGTLTCAKSRPVDSKQVASNRYVGLRRKGPALRDDVPRASRKVVPVAYGLVVLLLMSIPRAEARETRGKRVDASASAGSPKDSNKEVEALIKKAIDLRREGKDKEALAELRRASDIERQPRVAAQIGMAEQALGLWPAAERDLREGLGHEGDPWIKQNRATLQDALTFIEGHLANLDVWGPPDGAEMYLDGERVGVFPLPGPVRVPAGNPELLIQAKGFAAVRRPLEVKAGANVREHVVLRSLALDLPPPAPAPAEAPPMAPAPKVAEASAGDDDEPSIFSRWWFWTAAGVVVAGAGVGTYFALHKNDSCTSSATRTCSSF